MTEARDAVLKPLFRRHLRRPRLTALLDEATAQSMLVIGPAGYGKTTLAREWLQGREHVAWYHATPASADVGAFSAGLADAVAHLVPEAGERVRRRLRVGDATERLARPLAELLSEDLEAWPEGGIVVLDDYHLLAESKPVEDFLDWLLSLAPLRVLVTTRRRPGWATARRFLYGEAVEIGRDQLAMTDEEATQVLHGRSTESVRALVRRAEGWPALIGLASLSADLDAPAERVSESLFRYFAEEVLRGESAEVQRFMLAASIPAAVDLRIAREVLGFADPEPIVERLRDADLLREVAAGEFRFHPLLREFLRRRLEAADHSAFVEGARRIVEDAREYHRWEEAFELTRETGEAGEAAEVAGLAARRLLASGQSETLEKWLAACGAAAVTIAGAALARAELLIRKGEMSAAASLAQDTAARLPENHPDYAWANNLSGRALHFTSQEEAAFERFEAGKQAAKTDEDLKESLWGLVVVCHELDPDRISHYVDMLESSYSDDVDVRFRLAIGRFGAAEQTDSIAGAWDRFAALLPSIKFAQDPLVATSFLAIAAAAANLRGDYSVARELAEDGFRICGDLRLDFGLGAFLAYRAAAETGCRRFLQAQRTLRSLEQSSIRREDPYFQVMGLDLQARLLACQGALFDALETENQLPVGRTPPRPLGIYLAARSIIRAASGDSAGAREESRRARIHGSSIEMRYCSRLGEAIADDVDGNSDRFTECATKIVVECGRADYLDGLILAYRTYPRLLEVTAANAQALATLRRALTQSRDFKIARSAGIDVALGDAEETLGNLTKRELEVLGLLSQGMTNAEIANRLFIAPSTAKVHVRHILEKLGARNRLHAVVRAHELLESDPS